MWELLSRFSNIWNDKLPWIGCPMALGAVLIGLAHRDWWNCRFGVFFLIRNILMTYNAVDTFCQESGPIRNFNFSLRQCISSFHLRNAGHGPRHVACTLVQSSVGMELFTVWILHGFAFFHEFFFPFRHPFHSSPESKPEMATGKTKHWTAECNASSLPSYTFRVQFWYNGAYYRSTVHSAHTQYKCIISVEKAEMGARVSLAA